MNGIATSPSGQAAVTPLEDFLHRFTVCAGGLLEEIEPQVYALLLPEMQEPLRLTVNPEALPEHPKAQLLAFGSAVLDDLLARARSMGRVVTAYVQDVNLAPHGLEQRLNREFAVPEGVTLHVNGTAPRHVTHSVFWFKVTYMSDSKEEAVFTVGLDRYYGRQVKYLTEVMAGGRLVEQRVLAVPDAPPIPLDETYVIARSRLLRTLSADANIRSGELQARLSSQRARLRSYYEDLKEELTERREKLLMKEEDPAPIDGRLAALRREEALRIEELDKQSILRAELRLVNVLHIKIPRLFLAVRAAAAPKMRLQTPKSMTLTWDPLTDHFDAAECPTCKSPTYEFVTVERNQLGCYNCSRHA